MKHASADRAKRHSNGCRNHGSCAYCRRSRMMATRRVMSQYSARIREWMNERLSTGEQA